MLFNDADGGGPLPWPSTDEVLPAETAAGLPADPDAGDNGTTPPAPPAAETTPPAGETTPPAGATEPPAGTEPPATAEVEDGKIPEAILPYVQQLRHEAAERRTAVKPYEEAFDGYEPAQRDHFLQLAKGLTDPDSYESTAREFVRIGAEILKEIGVDVGELNAPDPNRPLTLKELEERERRQEAARQEAAAIEQITKEVADLGYDEADDPASYYALLRFAQDEGGDFKKADEKVKAYHKQIIDNFIAEARKNGDQWVKTPPALGTPPNDHAEPPTEWGDARKRVMDMLG